MTVDEEVDNDNPGLPIVATTSIIDEFVRTCWVVK